MTRSCLEQFSNRLGPRLLEGIDSLARWKRSVGVYVIYNNAKALGPAAEAKVRPQDCHSQTCGDYCGTMGETHMICFSRRPLNQILSLPDRHAVAKEQDSTGIPSEVCKSADFGRFKMVAVPGFEPGLPDSESGVLTTTLYRSECHVSDK